MQRGEHLPRTRREFAFLAFFGIAMITSAERRECVCPDRLHSNEVALLNTSLAFWIVVLGTLGPMGQKLPRRSVVGLLLGFCGVAMIVWPHGSGFTARIGWQALAIGRLFRLVGGDGGLPQHAAGDRADRLQRLSSMLIGSAGLFVGGAVSGELPHWHWELPGMLALLYLAVVGSALAYTSVCLVAQECAARTVSRPLPTSIPRSPRCSAGSCSARR
jgi:drug/metabolite transporter (DMT)-like permease